MQWFYDLSIRKKLYVIFGAIVVGTIVGVAVGQYSFSRVTVGGKLYRGIELKKDSIDLVSEMRGRLSVIRGDLYSQVLKYDEGEIKEIKNQIAGTDSLFEDLLGRMNASRGSAVSCTSCHSAQNISAVFAPVEEAHANWLKMKKVLEGRVSELADSHDSEALHRIMDGEVNVLYAAIMEDLGAAVNMLKGVSPLQVASIVKEANTVRVGYVVGGTVSIVFLVIVAVVISSLIITPVRDVAHYSVRMAEGHFADDIKISTKGKDEIGRMADAFLEMSGRLRETIGQITQDTLKVVSASEGLSRTSENLNQGSQEQAAQTEQVAASMTEMSQTIMDVAKNAGEASEAAGEASEVAAYGKDTSNYAISSIQSSAAVVKDASEIIEALGSRSKEIGDIVSVITEIADQTNLLALNAAIEAARAGEQGRGFAVVADEVRKLAERTGKATEEIREKIRQIQGESEKSVDTMRKSKAEVDKGVELINAVSQTYDSIVSASAKSADMIQRIAAASEEQSTAAEEVSQNMESISTISRGASENASHIKEAAASLATLAADLQKLTSWFRI
jgi:methyl-accepting chemotaxis protein